MLARLAIPGAWMYSAWQPDRGMSYNSYFFERDGGCVAIDPLPLDAGSLDELQNLGGVHTIVLTNRDHQRDAAHLKARFASRVLAHGVEASLFDIAIDATFSHGDEVFAGAFALALPHGKTAGEVALHFPAVKTAVVGDALIGAPAGALGILPDKMLENPKLFLFGLRRLWALQLQTLLLCDGQSLFGRADNALATFLETRAGAEINRINADEIEYTVREGPSEFRADDGEVGLLIGARKLGYRLAKIPPAKAWCPLHWHVEAEEFFYVIAGRPTIRTLRGNIQCRAGDFIAFPTGERGAHQVRNDSDEPCLVMLAGLEEAAVSFEACFYPDSDKVGLWTLEGPLRMVRASPDLDYFDGETEAKERISDVR
ncbi:MAG TPA: cupin domain-containing protein [Candidatus Rubrimentiphilum sp.]|nr:cupin domain-containing protein [Candidatus Rubrimentiphilum sp.]